MGTQGPRTLKPYPLDHTVLAMEDPSKASPVDILGEDLERGTCGEQLLHLLTFPSLSPPSPSSRPLSQIFLSGLFHSLLPRNLLFNPPTSYSST